MTLKVVDPINVTEAVLTASGIPEPDASVGEVLWQDEANKEDKYTLQSASGLIKGNSFTHNNYGELILISEDSNGLCHIRKFDSDYNPVGGTSFESNSGIASANLDVVGSAVDGEDLVIYWQVINNSLPEYQQIYKQKVFGMASNWSTPPSISSDTANLASVPAEILNSVALIFTQSGGFNYSSYATLTTGGAVDKIKVSKLDSDGSLIGDVEINDSTTITGISTDEDSGVYISNYLVYSPDEIPIKRVKKDLSTANVGSVKGGDDSGAGQRRYVSFYRNGFYVGSRDASLSLTQVEVRPYSINLINTGAYKKGDEVILTDTHRRYRCLVNETFSNPKDTATGDAAAEWIDIGSTNKWKMFNGIRQTKTTSTDQFTVILEPVTYVNTLAALAISGVTSIRVEVDNTGSTTIYDKTFTTSDFSAIYDHYTYVFYQIAVQQRLVIEDLPPLPNSTIRVTFNGSIIAVGELVHGFAINVGELVAEDTKSDRFRFREQEFDDFGYPTGPKPITVELNTYDVLVPKLNNPAIQSLLDKITGENTLWIGDIGGGQKLTTYGFFERSPIPFDMPNDINYQITVRASV